MSKHISAKKETPKYKRNGGGEREREREREGERNQNKPVLQG